MTLVLKNVSYSFKTATKQQHKVIEDLNMEIASEEFVSLIGKSGTGKSTILKLITGLLQQDEGVILINEKPISLGDVAYMPQQDLLLPWRTVLENAMLATELNKQVKVSKNEARELLERAGLIFYENALPKQLSGGMRQRVAFVRSLLAGKDVLLLDEPFGALDALTKKQMQTWLLSLWQESKKTVLFITHDIEEACFLSDRIVLLHPQSRIEAIPVGLKRPRKLEMVHEEEFMTIRKNIEKKITDDAY